jgi:hypothetical protein
VLFGGRDVDNEERSGGRFTAGFWLDDCHTVGVEGSYFFLGSRAVQFGAAGTGAPGSAVIARPFFDTSLNQENSELVSAPGLLAGTVNVTSSSRLQGGAGNLICNLCCGCCYRVDLLGGFRYVDLEEGLGVGEDLMVLPTVPGIGGGRVTVLDQFDARNRFYGGQLGARGEARRGPWFVNVQGLIALGDTHEVVTINGATALIPVAGTPTVSANGLLTQPTNIGRFSRDQFAVVPEVDVNVGYQVTDHLRAFVGYTFLYWSDVVRPGDQIDRVLNPNQLPATLGASGLFGGPARPAFSFHGTDFWAQGINFGVEFRY